MSDTVQLGLIGLFMAAVAAIAPIIIAYAQVKAIRVQITANTKITEESAKKIDDVADRTIEIHTATNGTLHEMKAEIRVANARMQDMTTQITTLIQDRIDTAKTAEKLALNTAGAISSIKFNGGVAAKVDTVAAVHEDDKSEQDKRNETFVKKDVPKDTSL